MTFEARKVRRGATKLADVCGLNLLRTMSKTPLAPDSIPPDCFRQSEVETLQTFDHQTLGAVHYYLWRASAQSAFLYALEMYFDNGKTLLLSSGESSEAIQLIAPQALVDTAVQLKNLEGTAIIQHLVANVQPIWRDVLGMPLQNIQLSRHEGTGLYRNDALLLDFGAKQILIELSEKDGLELGEYD